MRAYLPHKGLPPAAGIEGYLAKPLQASLRLRTVEAFTRRHGTEENVGKVVS